MMGFSSGAQMKIKDLKLSRLDRQINGHFIMMMISQDSCY